MLRTFKALILNFVFTLIGLSAHAAMPSVDLRDVARYGSEVDSAQAQALINQIRANPQAFALPVGITYPKEQLSSIGQFAVSTALLQNITPNGFELFLVYAQGKQVLMNKLGVDAYGQMTLISQSDFTREPPVAQIDIFNRQMVLFDRKSGFTKYMPVSLGALVNTRLGDVTSPVKSLSPAFARTMLSKRQSEASRTNPDYYRGRPFLRILNLDQSQFGGFTAFGLHYQISDVFQRGFVSNGCFRLRDTDLYELAGMVFNSRKDGVPMSIVRMSNMGNRHPYPMINEWYNSPRTEMNSRGQSVLTEDSHGLYIFDQNYGDPEMLLQGF